MKMTLEQYRRNIYRDCRKVLGMTAQEAREHTNKYAAGAYQAGLDILEFPNPPETEVIDTLMRHFQRTTIRNMAEKIDDAFDNSTIETIG